MKCEQCSLILGNPIQNIKGEIYKYTHMRMSYDRIIEY